MIQDLSRRRDLEKAIALLDTNISLLDSMIESFTDLDDIVPSSFPIIPPDNSGSVRGRTTLSRNQISALIDDWASNHYNDNDYFLDGKIQTASDGSKVRSKSELVIYEFLCSHGIAFRYEEPLICRIVHIFVLHIRVHIFVVYFLYM